MLVLTWFWISKLECEEVTPSIPFFFPTGLLSAIDIVEVNPKLAKKEEEAQLTASVAVDLVLGCFGRVREGSHRDDYKIPEP